MLPKTDSRIIDHVDSIKNKKAISNFVSKIQPDVHSYIVNSARDLTDKIISMLGRYEINITMEDEQYMMDTTINDMSTIWYIEHITRNFLLSNKKMNVQKYFNSVLRSDGDYDLFKKAINQKIEINMDTIEGNDIKLPKETIDKYDELEEDFSGITN